MSKTSIIDTAVLKEKVQGYAMKVGRICARPTPFVALLHHGQQGHSEKSDKLMILVTMYKKR